MSSFSVFASKPSSQITNSIQKQFIAKQDTDGGSCSQVVLEKNENENENEDSMQMQVLLLPFVISQLQLQLSTSNYITAQSVAVTHTNPIYLSVCNFRV